LPLSEEEMSRLADQQLDMLEGVADGAVEAEKERAGQDHSEKEVMVSEGRRRLENRLRHRLVEVKLCDDEGEFTIAVRPMSIVEQRRFDDVRLKMKELGPAPTIEQQKPLDDETCKLLALICHDKSLDYAYWKKGDYSADLPPKLILAAIGLSSEDEKSIRFFRREQ
jgi:hypothetical protein